tara:strand:+ start:16955 stop:17923 length:969 start_codon:yes stop_codon:yes gene_type:complete
MKTEIEVQSNLPAITTNFDLVKADLSAELEKYNNVVVTIDTLTADKKLAQEISAKGKEFDKIRKDKVAEISEPINVFATQMKELSSMCTGLAGTIKSQVKVFEDAKLKEIHALLKNTMMTALDEAEIDDEFRVLSIDHLIKLGAITKGGALTKGSKDAINAIVADKRVIMQTTQLRLAQLEAESFKAGLDIPLVRLNVEQFIFDSDENYSNHLKKVIQSEFERQQAAKARKKELADKEVASAVEPVKKEEVQQQEQPKAQLRSQQVEHKAPSDGKVAYTATAQFKLRVPPHITERQIQDKLEQMLTDAGINSLYSLGVMRDA